MQWPAVAIPAHLLPTGKVLFYPIGDIPRLWDPANGTITPLPSPGYNIFCSGHAFLGDGRLLVAGGQFSVQGEGVPFASIFNPNSNTWTRTADMKGGRWYPTATTLSDGSVLVVSGSQDAAFTNNPLPQVWQPNGTWRDLTNAVMTLPMYPYMFLAPNGQVFNAGPNITTRYLDTAGAGQWIPVANRALMRDYGSAVLYDFGKILLVGGKDPPTATAEVIDLSADNPSWRGVASMSTPRRQVNATVLPDGKVLVTGGSSANGFSNEAGAVFHGEIWDPATETWSSTASMAEPRLYHSTALLLPDGRVLSAGTDGHPTAEIYSPPYLFKGARPTITSAPPSVDYSQFFFVATPQAANITKVTTVRLGSVTHSFNMEQRWDSLAFEQANGGVNVFSPSNINVAPPGYYLLFLINSNGVPSVGHIMRFGAPAGTVPPPPSNLTATAFS
jgi:hypothetical protein